jgi:type II secretory ATPase GspE/PulE/Tfp pilus assembly ATPase PilB-like protein
MVAASATSDVSQPRPYEVRRAAVTFFVAFPFGARRPPNAPAATTGSAYVEIGFLDGNVRSGKLEGFNPTMQDLQVDFERFGRASLAAEHVAYIAFHRVAGAHVSAAPTDGAPMDRFRIHASGGTTFEVDVSASAINSNLGFRGYPTDPSSPYRAVFFYAHGVNAREKAAPLGEMLVESGVVGPQSLRRGVEAQAANRNVPLGQLLVEKGEIDDRSVDTAMALQARRKLRLGQILVEAGLATEDAIERALSEQKQHKGKRIGEVLVEMGIVREIDLTITLGKKFQLRVVDLDEYRIEPAAATQVPREVITKYGVLPIASTATSLTVAIGDPLAIDAIEVLRFHVKRRIDEVLVVPSQLRRFVDEFLVKSAGTPAQQGQQLDTLLRDLRKEDAFAGAEVEEDDDARDVTLGGEADGGIVKVVNQIIIDAFRRDASDIHIEPNGKDRDVAVRFRIDGECFSYQGVPAAYRNQLIARIKIMAGLDISERRKPQDGKIRFHLGDRIIELRVATLPTVNRNEDAVLRILASSKPLPLDKMGLGERNLRELRAAINQPYGLILCVGPTGSGKTTTLHSALGDINKTDTKIWTAEDPVEITQPGLRQVQVSPKIGLTFAAAMRAFLRADPDVIMVGEMRDHETASTAVEASLTGHLVLSTLHTNTAPETITRLLDMGLDPFSFGDSLLAIVAQRLARTLCSKCRTCERGNQGDFEELLRAYDEATLESSFGVTFGSDFRVWRAKGCETCRNTGYKGRVGVHEVLVMNDELRTLVAHKGLVEDIRRVARASGMTTLLQDGVAKAIAGMTDMKQVLAVCSK